MSDQPKIGLLLLTAAWFIDIGASGGTCAALPELLRADGAAVEAALSGELAVVSSGVLARTDEVAEAAAWFRAEGVAGVVVCPLTWCEDQLLLTALEALPGVPMLVWCYTPVRALPDPISMTDLFRGSGAVAALQFSGPLKRMGVRVATAVGSHKTPETVREVTAFGKAAGAAARLRSARIGVLPHRCAVMTGTWIDDDRLHAAVGPTVVYPGLEAYRAACDAVSDNRVAAFIAALRAQHPVAPTVTAVGLARAARVSLGLADLALVHNLDAVALEDIGEELHAAVELRPCLHVPALFERAVVSMEADVGAAAALLILRALTGLPVMYVELFGFDETEQAMLAGHAGMMDARLAADPAEVLLEPDGEYAGSEPDSCWMRFRARGGRVTLCSLFADADGFILIAAGAQAHGGPPRLHGSPHAWLSPDTPPHPFFTRCLHTGMTQHWALVHADVRPELRALSALMGWEWVEV